MQISILLFYLIRNKYKLALLTVAGLTGLLSACSSPVKVQKVSSAAPVNGARYCIKRPSLSLSFQVKMARSKLYKLSMCDKGANTCTNEITGEIENVGDVAQNQKYLDDWDIGMQYCLVGNSQTDINFNLTFAQNLNVTEYYEIEHKYNMLGLIDSQLEVTTDEEGCLSSVTSKETDQLLEAFTSAANFSISKTKQQIEANQRFAIKRIEGVDNTPTLANSEKSKSVTDINRYDFGFTLGMDCLYMPEVKDINGRLRRVHNPSFQRYVARHISNIKREKSIALAIDDSYESLASTSAETRKNHLENITLLKSEKSLLEAKLKAVGFSVPKDKYHLYLNGKSWGTPGEPKDKWFHIELCESGMDAGKEPCQKQTP